MKIPISSKLQQRVPSPASSARRLQLRLPRRSNIDARSKQIIRQVLAGLPQLYGSPICVWAQPHLKAHQGKLLSGRYEKGMPVHAAGFIRRRAIVLETQLLARPQKLKLILVHELFHFVWARLGNRKRAGYRALIEQELMARARGETGESADCWKQALVMGGTPKNYVCESFCDTAAWLYSGVHRNSELTLSNRWLTRRRRWFLTTFLDLHGL